MRKRSWIWWLTLMLALAGLALAQSADEEKQQEEPSVKAYLLVGDVYYSSGEYDAAMIAFRRALEKEPNNVYALYGLGRTQLKMHQFTSAIENLKRAIAIDGAYAPLYVALAQAYTDRYLYAEDKKAAEEFLDQALLILDDARRVDPNYHPTYNQRGLVYQYKGELDKAEQAFKKALELAPQDAVVRYNLAQVHLSQGRLDDALAMLAEGVELDPSSAQLQLLYGKVLAVKGKLPEAEQALAAAAELQPLNARNWLNLGQVHYLQGEYDEAVEALSKAIELDPLGYPEAYYYLGRAQLDAGRAEEARLNLTKAVKLAPDNADYHFWLAKALIAKGEREAAKAELERVLELAPDHASAKKELTDLR
ncbi:MAG TPA: tetratricopeptide repeat protein [Oceanithermus profundus]|uniref:Tetratricopeptide repeat protein n=1 Tax=Oceanithermus profundus TaxID=187137 RepID=A0A7C4VDK3_9DEIN|nr:tetratricopeptide repeat protein [Oceanithermus profundus]